MESYEQLREEEQCQACCCGRYDCVLTDVKAHLPPFYSESNYKILIVSACTPTLEVFRDEPICNSILFRLGKNPSRPTAILPDPIVFLVIVT